MSILMRKPVIQIRQACLSTNSSHRSWFIVLCNFHLTHCWLLCNALKLLGSLSQRVVLNYCISFHKGRNHLLSSPLSAQLLTLELTYNFLLKAWIEQLTDHLCVRMVRLWVMASHMQFVSTSCPLSLQNISRVHALLTSSTLAPRAKPLSSLTWIGQILTCLPASTLPPATSSLFSTHQLEWYTLNVYVSARTECTVPGEQYCGSDLETWRLVLHIPVIWLWTCHWN